MDNNRPFKKPLLKYKSEKDRERLIKSAGDSNCYNNNESSSLKPNNKTANGEEIAETRTQQAHSTNSNEAIQTGTEPINFNQQVKNIQPNTLNIPNESNMTVNNSNFNNYTMQQPMQPVYIMTPEDMFKYQQAVIQQQYMMQQQYMQQQYMQQQAQIPTLREVLESIKNEHFGVVLRALNLLMEMSEDSFKIQIGQAPNGILNFLNFSIRIQSHSEIISEFKNFMLSKEMKDKIIEMLKLRQNVKILKPYLYTNLTEFGSWENITIKDDMDKIKIFQNIISFNCKETCGFFIKWAKGHAILQDYKKLFSDIHNEIMLNENFLFDKNDKGKSLKEMVMENPWINFKNYIVNYQNLNILKKNIVELNGIKVVESFIFNKKNYKFSIMNDFPFDYYIDTDPLIVETEDGFELKEPSKMDLEMLYYIRDTMFDGDTAKLRQLLQHIGYCISPKKNQKKALFIIGDSNTGKSKLANLIGTLYPKELTATYKISKLNSDEARKELMTKKINIGNESNKRPTDLDTFKTIVSGEEDKYKSSKSVVSDLYNIGLIFIANEFIKPFNKSETRDFPEGYLDKFTIIKARRKEEKWTMSKEEFESKMMAESTKQALVTMAIYELEAMYNNKKETIENGIDTFSFEFIETEDEIQEKKDHVRKWLENEEKNHKKDNIEEYYAKSYSNFKYWPGIKIEAPKDSSEEESTTDSDNSSSSDVYGIKYFLSQENGYVSYMPLDELNVDIEEIKQLNDFSKIKNNIGKQQKAKGYEVTISDLYKCYAENMKGKVNICSEKDFTLKTKSLLSLQKSFYMFDVVDIKRNKSKSEKEDSLQKYKNIIIDFLERRNQETLYVIFFDEVAIKINEKKKTLTAYRGIRINENK